jgi:hypothetical protein
MTYKFKAGIAVAILAIASFLALQFFKPEDTPDRGPKTNANNTTFTHEAETSISPLAPSNAENHSLIDIYKRTRSGRTFLLYALQHVDQGGAYYADRLLSLCAETIHSRDWLSRFESESGQEADGMRAKKRKQALQGLQDRCGDILPEEYDEFKARIRAEKERGNDPLLKIRGAFLAARQSKSPAQASQAVAALKLHPDPLIADELGPWMAPALKAEMRAAGIDVEHIADDPKVLATLYLLPCQLGLDCSDSQDFMLMMACVSGANCADSRSEHVRLNMLGGQQADFASALESARRLAESLQRH